MNRNQIIGWVVIVFAIAFFVVLYVDRGGNKKLNALLNDIEGREYKTVRIGGQVWMAENLKVTKSPDGVNVKSFYPNNDRSKVQKYGRLYTWDVARKICPTGWVLPSENDWQILRNNLGTHAAAKLKDTLNWISPGFNTTNESHFTALPTGYGNCKSEESFFGIKAVYWTSTPKDSNNIYCRVIINNIDSLIKAIESPEKALAVRCLKK